MWSASKGLPSAIATSSTVMNGSHTVGNMAPRETTSRISSQSKVRHRSLQRADAAVLMVFSAPSQSCGVSRNRACSPSASRTHGTSPSGMTMSRGTHGASGSMNIQTASIRIGTQRCNQRE
ncbi:hypothetical protein GCM10020254_18750 [Streptomyces goshikiensis]